MPVARFRCGSFCSVRPVGQVMPDLELGLWLPTETLDEEDHEQWVSEQLALFVHRPTKKAKAKVELCGTCGVHDPDSMCITKELESVGSNHWVCIPAELLSRLRKHLPIQLL